MSDDLDLIAEALPGKGWELCPKCANMDGGCPFCGHGYIRTPAGAALARVREREAALRHQLAEAIAQDYCTLCGTALAAAPGDKETGAENTTALTPRRDPVKGPGFGSVSAVGSPTSEGYCYVHGYSGCSCSKVSP